MATNEIDTLVQDLLPPELVQERTKQQLDVTETVARLEQSFELFAMYDYDDETEQVTDVKGINYASFIDFMKEYMPAASGRKHPRPIYYDQMEKYWKESQGQRFSLDIFAKMCDVVYSFELAPVYRKNSGREVLKKACIEYSELTSTQVFDQLIDVKNPNMIQFENGVYNFETNTLVPPQPEYWQTVKMNYDLVPTEEKTEAEEWLEFLVGDAVTSLMELIGYCFYRDYNYASIMFFVNGKGVTNGKNGKSQVLNFISEVLSGNNSSVPLDGFDGSDKFAVSSLYTQLANLAGDAPDVYFDSMDVLKSASGNDELTAEFKGKDKFKFRNYAKLFFATNFLPRVKDTSSAVRERFLLVPFTRDLGTPENMKTLREKFNPNRKKRTSPEELGKFAWRAIQAFRKVLERDESLRAKAFSLTPTQLSMLETYMQDNDSIAQFFDDDDCQYIVTHDDSDKVNAKDFNQAYFDWCDENKFKAYGRYLKNEMANKGFEYRQAKLQGKNQRVYTGIKLKDVELPKQRQESPF